MGSRVIFRLASDPVFDDESRLARGIGAAALALEPVLAEERLSENGRRLAGLAPEPVFEDERRAARTSGAAALALDPVSDGERRSDNGMGVAEVAPEPVFDDESRAARTMGDWDWRDWRCSRGLHFGRDDIPWAIVTVCKHCV